MHTERNNCVTCCTESKNNFAYNMYLFVSKVKKIPKSKTFCNHFKNLKIARYRLLSHGTPRNSHYGTLNPAILGAAS